MIELLIMEHTRTHVLAAETTEATLLSRNFPFVSSIEPLEIPKFNRSTFESNKTLRDNALIKILSHFFNEDHTEEESCEHPYFNDLLQSASLAIILNSNPFVLCYARAPNACTYELST
jgi:hypothetical protein